MADTGQTVRLELGADPPVRLDRALADAAPEDAGLSRSGIGRLIAQGAVTRCDGTVVASAKQAARAGEVFTVKLPAAVPPEAVAEDIPLDIVFEDTHLLVINKPAGMVVHPAPGTPSGTLVNAILHHCGDRLSGIGGVGRPGIVHRIDKDTSGLLAVAKSDVAHQGLAWQFASHSIDRCYLAYCAGVPDTGDPRLLGVPGVKAEPGGIIRIAANIARHRTDRKRQAVVKSGGRSAITRIRVLRPWGRLAKIECRLETGRTHQIRVHMAYVGHGLVGDPAYGGARRVGTTGLPAAAVELVRSLDRQALHAARLGFVHPVTGETQAFEADLPHDLKELESVLGN
ncbi:MAG: RluA family pseudouridine synthase [Rhodobacteraceae bacterium]|nr:RluA family pseudouridine synthase [Paracoccaceae bacterium]